MSLAGLRSKEALEAKLRGALVLCEVKGRDLYGRNVSRCSVDNKADVGQWLVSNGYAIAYRSDHLISSNAHKGACTCQCVFSGVIIKMPIAAMLIMLSQFMMAYLLLASQM